MADTKATSYTAEGVHLDVLILRLEIDDLCTFPQCSTELIYNFEMAVQGNYNLYVPVLLMNVRMYVQALLTRLLLRQQWETPPI